jgi:hypothetical protein
MVQQLSDEDHKRRLDFCLQLQDLMSSDDHFLEKVQSSDEATFHISGAVNRRNVRIWGSENPQACVKHQSDSPKVNVFSAISSQKVYGPFFFAEETVTSMTYLDMLQLWLCHSCKTYRHSYSSKTEVPPTSTVRFVST